MATDVLASPEAAVHAGGCQCGAVRFRVTGVLGDASICHCRMCQKAFGAYYAPLVSTRGALLEWTRGGPRHYQSSNLVRRGFCGACGTPLTYEAPDGVALAAGAFDDPAGLPPWIQYGIEGRLPFVDGLAELPARRTDEDEASAAFLSRIVPCQHPDHDTVAWPPADADGLPDSPRSPGAPG
ncbi:GFA family protein [Pseudoxanthomonas daejeonensis]|uniref:GFA family protein n=1 Tax=Pseudoxanthomonas daejeonensis TaxID=266062 RepID=UPI001F5414C3|nr:GFA family protein [Pseudoxanthomonas daejeonensis]UNK56766.1 GFA family protein [Pseudoxanthomonas daejeonensis]